MVAERRVGGLGGLDGKRRDHRSDAGRWVGQAAANDDAGSRSRLVDGGRLGKRRQLLVLRLERASDSKLQEFDPASGGQREVATLPESAQAAGSSQRRLAGGIPRRRPGSCGLVRDRLATVYLLSICASGSVRQVLDGRCGLERRRMVAGWQADRLWGDDER